MVAVRHDPCVVAAPCGRGRRALQKEMGSSLFSVGKRA